MNIGIRAHDMEKAPIEDLVKNIKAKGFSCTQLALSKAIYEFNVSKDAMTPGMALHLKRIFDKHEVDIAVLGCYLNITNPDKVQNQEIMEIYKTHIRFASLLGCGMVGTETGAVNSEYKFEEANHSKEALASFIEHAKIVVDYAEKMGVIFGIEPVYNHIVSDIERADKVLRAINSPNLQIILDPVNLLSIHNHEKHEDIIKGAFQLFKKDIAVIHAKDYIIENNNIKSVPAGQGQLNYNVLLDLIKKEKPYIHVLLEDTNPTNAISTREFVETLYEKIV